MSDRKALDVFVRLGYGGDDVGDDDTIRVISFQIPDGLSQAKLLEEHYAIDGNSAVMTVEAHRSQFDRRTVEQSLLVEQQDLVKWLGEKGFDVVFK